MEPLSLGFSPCPNDTFIFHALVHSLIDSPVAFESPRLEDVETLNQWAMQKKLDVTKLSFHALGHVLDEYCLLRAGSALGRGCGPLVVAKKPLALHGDAALRIGIPGRYTTAALLFRMFAPECSDLIEMRFEEIIPAIGKGAIDAGVIIHESRFTYAEQGLTCLQDLGEWWETASGHPIPLGCIAARRGLGRKTILDIDDAIKRSLEHGYGHPRASLPYIRKYSQEMEEKVVHDHIGLYVNDFSLDLGEEGKGAIEHFLKRGREAFALPDSNLSLMV